MDAINATIPPDNTNPLKPAAAQNTPAGTRNVNATSTNTPVVNNTTAATHASGTHNSVAADHYNTGATCAHHSKLDGIKSALHDIKENVKETLQRDHHHGQDCAKKPQDGKTNPME